MGDGPRKEVRGVEELVKVPDMDVLGLHTVAPPVMVVTVEAIVVPLNVRVRSQANPFSPARETGVGDAAALLGKNHWVMRFDRLGTQAIVLRFSARGGVGRRSEEICEGIVRELAVDGESLRCVASFKKGSSGRSSPLCGVTRGVWGRAASSPVDACGWLAWPGHSISRLRLDSPSSSGIGVEVCTGVSGKTVSTGVTMEKCGINPLAIRTGGGA